MAVLARIRKYVPEVGGNRKLTEAEQIAVFLKPVSVYDKQVQMRKYLGMEPEQLLKEMMSNDGSNAIKKILADKIVRFENLDLVDEGGENKATASFEDVWNQGEFELVMEIFNNLLSHSQLKKDEEKNSDSPAGTTVATQIH